MSTDSAVLLARHDQLDLPLYCRIAFARAPVAVSDRLHDTVQRSRDALLTHLESGASAYGVNTGLGFLAARRVDAPDQAAFQRAILAGRAAGTGRPLSEPVVRGAMLLRLTGFLSGHAGVAAAARTLAAPASIHVADGSTGQEDFQTHTLLAATQLDAVLDTLELALAHELVALRQARHLAGAALPPQLETALGRVADVVAPVLEDRSLAGDIERCRELIASGRLAGGVASPSIWSSPTPA